MKKDFVIGVLGGMGTYATIHLFQQYAEVFSAVKEWDRPRIIIDNRCTMPSRVRAFLYNENVDQLIGEMTESMQGLIQSGCNKIVLACNTSHLFLPHIYKTVPDLEQYVIHIIDCCVKKIDEDNIKEIFLLGSEGTIESGIYQKALSKKNITCLVPKQDEFTKLRVCIEAVKQNKYATSVEETFLELVNRYDKCILGCTELPILFEKYRDKITCKKVYDPLYLGLCELKREYDNE